MKFESKIKDILYSQEKVYGKLSDLNNLTDVLDKMKDPAMREKLEAQIPESKLDSIQGYLDSMTVSADQVSVNVAPMGEIGFSIVERTPIECIKFKSTNSPVGLTLWIQVLPTSDTSSKIKLTVDADVNPFIAAMVSKPLKDGVERLADMLTMIIY